MNVHQWLITTHPHRVAEHIQYDEASPFQPPQLACAVKDLESTEYMYGKITSIFRYGLHYQVKNKYITFSFGLVDDVAVNLIVDLPTLMEWSGNLDFGNNVYVAP